MLSDYLPVFFQMLIAIGFAVVVLSLSVVFGKSARSNVTKDSAYECGMLPIGDGAPRFSVKFYLVAMLFVIFDIEVVFMYPWAVQFRDMIQVSTVPLLSIAGFAGILALAYVYALKKAHSTGNPEPDFLSERRIGRRFSHSGIYFPQNPQPSALLVVNTMRIVTQQHDFCFSGSTDSASLDTSHPPHA